jgi:hypothetical protein
MTGAPLAKRDPSWWNCEGNNYPDGIILPKIPWDQARVQRIRDILAERKRSLPDQNTDWEEFTAVFLPPAGFTAFFYVYNLGPQAIYHMRNDMKDEVSWSLTPFRACAILGGLGIVRLLTQSRSNGCIVTGGICSVERGATIPTRTPR